MANTPTAWYRGYIFSRPIRGQLVPQKVQNLIVRNYCESHGFLLQLSATETAITGSKMMLNSMLSEIGSIKGIVLYSMFTLPADPAERASIYSAIIENGCELHAALEECVVRSAEDSKQWEHMIRVSGWLDRAPFSGRYDKLNSQSMLDRFLRGEN